MLHKIWPRASSWRLSKRNWEEPPSRRRIRALGFRTLLSEPPQRHTGPWPLQFYVSADTASLHLHNLSQGVSKAERQRCLLWKKVEAQLSDLSGFPLHQMSQDFLAMALPPVTASCFFLSTILSVVSSLKLSEVLHFLIIFFVFTLQNDTYSPELHLRIRQTILAETCQTGKKKPVPWGTQRRLQPEVLVRRSYYW